MADQMNTVPRMISSAVFVRVMNTSVGHDCVVPLYRALARRRRALLLLRGFFPRHFRAGLACLGESDGDRLLAAGHFLSRPAGFQLALFFLAHRALDFLSCFLTVLRHTSSCTPRRASCTPQSRSTYVLRASTSAPRRSTSTSIVCRPRTFVSGLST